jgi:hypothetical protein
MRVIRVLVLAAFCSGGLAGTIQAQDAAGAGAHDGWGVTVYPVLVWVPLGIGADVDVPPSGGDAGGSGSIVDTKLDGAFFGGLVASNRVWRIEGYAIWASFGGDRPERPFLVVDMDLIYGTGRVGRRIAPDLYVTGGVRRVAFKYDVTLGDLRLTRKPGIWDPLVGIGWHREGRKIEWHAAFEGGGFGAGADVDLGASFRVDVKPIKHFGLVGGYDLLYLKVSDTVIGRTVTVKPTLHGPTLGIGFYF